MNLRHLSDTELHSETLRIARAERKILTELFHHLLEVQRRRLFSAYGKESLKTYCVESLGYSPDEAGRRIAALSVFASVPSIEEKLNSAELTLTHLLDAKSLFTQEANAGRALSIEKKVEVLNAMTGVATRDAFAVAQSFSPEPREKLRKLDVDHETLDLLQELQDLLAHANPKVSKSDLIKQLVRQKISELRIEPAAPRKVSKAEVLREVVRKADYKCENCGSRHALEIDHILPRALGGTDDPKNLRTLCRNCNQRAAIERFGLRKMDPFINRVRERQMAYRPGPANPRGSVEDGPFLAPVNFFVGSQDAGMG